MPYLMDEYGNLSSSESLSCVVTKDTLNRAVQKVLAFQHHRVHITAEDVLNILVDTQCMSESDLTAQLELYKKNNDYPKIPDNHFD